MGGPVKRRRGEQTLRVTGYVSGTESQLSAYRIAEVCTTEM